MSDTHTCLIIFLAAFEVIAFIWLGSLESRFIKFKDNCVKSVNRIDHDKHTQIFDLKNVVLGLEDRINSLQSNVDRLDQDDVENMLVVERVLAKVMTEIIAPCSDSSCDMLVSVNVDQVWLREWLSDAFNSAEDEIDRDLCDSEEAKQEELDIQDEIVAPGMSSGNPMHTIQVAFQHTGDTIPCSITVSHGEHERSEAIRLGYAVAAQLGCENIKVLEN